MRIQSERLLSFWRTVLSLTSLGFATTTAPPAQMRLLNLKRVLEPARDKFETFYDKPPPYAILSHTWEDGEVTYQDMQAEHLPESASKGSKKIMNFARSAVADGYQYGWVDTCCIDKTNLAELSEAINSMFRWYENSSKCYAYLVDVKQATFHDREERMASMMSARWFARGWTLQELTAPRNLVFYNQNWKAIGSKQAMALDLSLMTTINADLLKHERELSSFSVAERMSWTSKRRTTRPEDMAYSLLGLFGINMPLLYGEGLTRAFHRLQEEIMRNVDDHTILAWEGDEEVNEDHGDRNDSETILTGDTIGTEGEDRCEESPVLASSPRSFWKRGHIPQCNPNKNFSYNRTTFTMTSKGLHARLPIIRTGVRSPYFYAVLDCQMNNDQVPRCIPLVSVSDDERQFRRLSAGLVKLDELVGYPCAVLDVFIQYQPSMLSNKTSLQTNSKPQILWSTDKLETEESRRSLSMADTQQGSTSYTSIREEICIAGVTFWWMWESMFETLRQSSQLQTQFDIVRFVATCTVLTYTSFDYWATWVRAIYLGIPLVLKTLAVKLVGVTDSKITRLRHDARASSHTSFATSLIRYLRNHLERWASRRSAECWPWQNDRLVRMVSGDGEITSTFRLPTIVQGLSPSIAHCTVVIVTLRYGNLWPYHIWQYLIVSTALTRVIRSLSKGMM